MSFWLAFYGMPRIQKRPARRTRGTSRKHITIWPNCGTWTRRRKEKRKRPRRNFKATLIQAGGSHFQLILSYFQLLPSHIQLLPSHLQLFPSHRGNDSTNGEHQISSAIVSARWYNINKHWLMVTSDDADVICGHVTV